MKFLFMMAITSLVWATESEKVVVLGFDGADHKLVEQYLAEGKLPNLAKLKEMGDFKPLTPTNPPQTPVSWSTFATGLNPGKTQILDFIKRKEGTYLPLYALQGDYEKQVLFGEKNAIYLPIIAFVVSFGLFFLLLFWLKRKKKIRFALSLFLSGSLAAGLFQVASQWIPNTIPAVRTVRQGKPIWTILEENQRKSTVIRLPVTFPAEPLNGQMIAGLPVPDIRATIGKPTVYTNDPLFEAGSNQFSVEVKILDGNGPYQTEVLGPPNKLFYNAQDRRQSLKQGIAYNVPKDFAAHLTIHPGNPVRLEWQGQSLSLQPGQWSSFVSFEYQVNPLITLKGFSKFYLEQADPYFKLYLGPINLHPDMPMPLSYPADLIKQTWNKNPFETIGWAVDTWSISSGLMGEDHFLDDMNQTVDRFEELMLEFLASDQDLHIQVFSFTDLIGHVMWRFMDPEHPLYEADRAQRFQKAVEDAYIRMDNIVGKAMAQMDLEKEALIICSDHGFASFRQQFNTNTWLVKHGYLALKKNVLGEAMQLDDLQTGSTPFNSVDWANTKAYALGLGMIFINLEGREPEGSVSKEDYDSVRNEIIQAMESYVDENGIHPVKKVYTREEMYGEFAEDFTPDLRAANQAPYRVSWDTTLGGMPAKITEDNLQNWSGDHCSLDPKEVPGILFSNRKVNVEEPQMLDMCPSMLSLLGLQPEPSMKGRIIF